MTRIIAIASALLMLCAAAAPAQAAVTKDELKARFEARAAELSGMKKQGQVGETVDGYVDSVDAKAADAKVAKLVSDENRDRRLLYQILADEINKENPQARVKATVETIAARNALRNIERAGPDELLRVAKDHWILKKDFPRYEKLTKLKTQGKVGETADGLVEIINPADRADAAISSLVKQENDARTAEYKALAATEHVDISVIAKRMGQRNFDNARIGDMLKQADGSWRKK